MKHRPLISPKTELALACRIAELNLPIEALEEMPEPYSLAFFTGQAILCIQDLPCGGCQVDLIKSKT